MTTTTTENAPAPQRQSTRSGPSWRSRMQQMLAAGTLVLIFIAFSIASPEIFPTWGNIVTILYSTVVIGLLALGATFVITTAGIDLSVGTAMALCAVMSGLFIVNWGLPVPLGIMLAILFGGLVGLVNGINVAILDLPPFIATLAMMMVAGGLALVFSGAAPIYFEQPSYMWLSTGSIIPSVPNAVLVLLLAAVIAAVLMSRTVLGRYTMAIGANQEAAGLAGVAVRKWLLIVYTVGGLFTGLAGVMISARLGSAQPATGMGYELDAIAAVVIGGTSLSGGRGTIAGTMIGALIISTLTNGLQILSIPQEWQDVLLGAVILVAVFIDRLRKRRERTS
ncbi:ABC transporter permease [Brachybacterium fresconis]|uniref:Ribose transport system permease protein n=1 Tax=Brachybacterium fresconis TaxID=173363 RepID=A0ABS4YNG9_9MICO|nr:ABC transporter permease [Brachybacterium fresconis]MBP2410336.1 ribose transport system permease protein [Brachybacterium fresconis]